MMVATATQWVPRTHTHTQYLCSMHKMHEHQPTHLRFMDGTHLLLLLPLLTLWPSTHAMGSNETHLLGCSFDIRCMLISIWNFFSARYYYFTLVLP